jgi:hypothetical protein
MDKSLMFIVIDIKRHIILLECDSIVGNPAYVHSILEPASHDQASRDRDDIMEQLANM